MLVMNERSVLMKFFSGLFQSCSFLSVVLTAVVAVSASVVFVVLIIVLILAGIMVLLIWKQRKAVFSFKRMENHDPTSMETFQKISEPEENAYKASE